MQQIDTQTQNQRTNILVRLMNYTKIIHSFPVQLYQFIQNIKQVFRIDINQQLIIYYQSGQRTYYIQNQKQYQQVVANQTQVIEILIETDIYKIFNISIHNDHLKKHTSTQTDLVYSDVPLSWSNKIESQPVLDHLKKQYDFYSKQYGNNQQYQDHKQHQHATKQYPYRIKQTQYDDDLHQQYSNPSVSSCFASSLQIQQTQSLNNLYLLEKDKTNPSKTSQNLFDSFVRNGKLLERLNRNGRGNELVRKTSKNKRTRIDGTITNNIGQFLDFSLVSSTIRLGSQQFYYFYYE